MASHSIRPHDQPSLPNPSFPLPAIHCNPLCQTHSRYPTKPVRGAIGKIPRLEIYAFSIARQGGRWRFSRHRNAVYKCQRMSQSETSLSYLLGQGLDPLLLGVGVDVGANAKGQDVEEWHPGMFWKELLCKGQRQWRRDPADFHHGHEPGTHGGTDLMPGAGTGDDGHGCEVDGILDGSNLRKL